MMNAHERVYRALLTMYPQQHRREYGTEMVQLFRDRFRDEGGGLRSALVWTDIGSDLVKTAFTERMEMTTMDNLKQNWWVVTAPLLAALVVFLGFGNMVTDDGGAFWGRAVAFGLTVALGAAVAGGLILRRRNKGIGSLIVGLAIAPGSVLTMIFWFPPVAMAGVLCAATSIRALVDWQRRSSVGQGATI